jgi:hypothetical protein
MPDPAELKATENAVQLPPTPDCNLIAGDWIDMLTGEIIVGPYCEWPRRELNVFVVSWDINARSG